MNDHIDASMKDAAKVVDEAKDRAGVAAHRARSALVDGLHAMAGAVTTFRGLGLADALGWLGLQRRRGSGSSILAFGAGFVSGAAAGLLCAPLSGAETRKLIADRIAGAVRTVTSDRRSPEPAGSTTERTEGVRRAGENGGAKHPSPKPVGS